MEIRHRRTSGTSSASGTPDTQRTSIALDDQTRSHSVWRIAVQDVTLIHLYLRNHAKIFWTHVGLLLALASVLASSGIMQTIDYRSLSKSTPYCEPGGNFDVTEAYNPWDSKHTLQITLGFGRLSFTAAKVIDVTFDLVIGRGGQFLLTVLCFVVFSKSLNRMLDQPNRSISYEGYKATIFDRPTLTSTFNLIKDLKLSAVWQAKASILWMAIASIYVVAFPTTISAMTGYSSNVDPFLNRDTGKIPVTYETFHRVIYRVNGADRIQRLYLNSTYQVGSDGFGFTGLGDNLSAELDFQLCLEHWWKRKTEGSFGDPMPHRTNQHAFANDCEFAGAISSYIIAYGPNPSHLPATNLTILDDLNYEVAPPGLVIEVFNTNLTRPTSNALSQFEGNTSSPLMYAIKEGGTEIYSHTEINENIGTCDRNKTYMWGFSFILLFSFLVVTGVWVIGMYIMWSETFWNSRIDHYGREMGFFRGVVDVSNAIWKDTLKEPDGLASNSEIQKLLAESPSGGKVTLPVDRVKLPPSRKEDFQRFARNVPSLCGWTKSWTSLHWGWSIAFAICGFLWASWPLAAYFKSFKTLRVVQIVSLFVTAGCWLVTVARFLAAILVKTRPAGYLEKMALFAITGTIAFLMAISTPKPRDTYSTPRSTKDYDFLIQTSARSHLNMFKATMIITTIVSASFWLPALLLFSIGLVSTIWRWYIQLADVACRLFRDHQPIPQTTNDLSNRDPAVVGTELDYMHAHGTRAELE